MQKSVAIIGSRGYPSFYGGFETLVRELAPYLCDEGWNVTVYGRPGAVKPGSMSDVRVESIFTAGVETKSLSTLSYGLTASLSVARRKPDVALVLNVANGYWLPVLAARSIPAVVNVDGIEWEREKWGPFARSVFKGGAMMTAKFASSIVVDAKAIGDRWESGFGRHGIFIPYGGTVPSSNIKPDFLGGRPYVLMVARFVPENTVPEFLEAAQGLAESWDVVIVGSSGYGGELDARADELQTQNYRIHWLGHVSNDDQLFGLWMNASVYFHGHSVGGTNPALVQAMACGAPTVARDTVYNREVLGESASYCNPTSESIQNEIGSLMGDVEMRSRLSEEVLERSRNLYSWQNVCELYSAALQDAVVKSRVNL